MGGGMGSKVLQSPFRSAPFEREYALGVKLAQGNFGTVYECEDRQTGYEFAVKVAPAASELEQTMIRREVAIMHLLRHPHCLSLHSVSADRGVTYAVVELCRGGSLRERMSKGEPYHGGETVVRDIMRSILEALYYMHILGVVHRDLAPKNLLFAHGDWEGAVAGNSSPARDRHTSPTNSTTNSTNNSPTTRGRRISSARHPGFTNDRLVVADFGLACFCLPNQVMITHRICTKSCTLHAPTCLIHPLSLIHLASLTNPPSFLTDKFLLSLINSFSH
jgi:serine/threonine protein kinase